MSPFSFQASKRIFGIPDFGYYAIADGIRELLHRYDKGVIKDPVCASHRKQLALFDLSDFWGKS